MGHDYTPNLAHTGLDFDTWMELARSDPEGFEAQRRKLIEARIQRAPRARRQRLRGLQFRIDMERTKARTPMGGCIRLSSMMWDSVVGTDGLCERVRSLVLCVNGACPPPPRPPTRLGLPPPPTLFHMGYVVEAPCCGVAPLALLTFSPLAASSC